MPPHNPNDEHHTTAADEPQRRRAIRRRLPIFFIDMSGRGNDYWVTVSWKPTDPWAVTLSIPHSTSPVDWLLARDLLWSGLNIPTGSGDVRIEPVTARDLDDEDQIEIRLYGRRNARCAHLIVTRRDLWEFLQATKAHFPDARDTARAGIDAEIARLLARPTAAPGEEAT